MQFILEEINKTEADKTGPEMTLSIGDLNQEKLRVQYLEKIMNSEEPKTTEEVHTFYWNLIMYYFYGLDLLQGLSDKEFAALIRVFNTYTSEKRLFEQGGEMDKKFERGLAVIKKQQAELKRLKRAGRL